MHSVCLRLAFDLPSTTGNVQFFWSFVVGNGSWVMGNGSLVVSIREVDGIDRK